MHANWQRGAGLSLAGLVLGIGAAAIGAWLRPPVAAASFDPAWCSGAARVSSLLPDAQAHDPSMQIEHDAMMALVPLAQATHTAAASGNWSSPATWTNGQIPSADARVVIPVGVRVVYDLAASPVLRTLRVDGELAWLTSQNTQLTLDTLVVTVGGNLNIGTQGTPVAAHVRARIVFADRGAIDTVWDPLRLSRGMLAHGQTRIRGASKRPFAALNGPVAAGAPSITLAVDPIGWRVGDEIVVTGSRKRGWMWDGQQISWFGTEDETRTVAAINQRTLTLSAPLARPHSAPQAGFSVYVANLSRNVVFETEHASTVPTQQRGHVMFMHEGNVQVEFVEFRQLGRTDKNIVVDDVAQQVDGSPGAGTNPRGRYPLHLHRTGARDAMGAPALVHGNSVIGSPGWGFVNHDSNVLIEDNVSFDVFGAGFVTEIGNELGTFKRNLAILGKGSTRHFKVGVELHDLAHSGHGFWFQGRNLIVEDNIAVGQSSAAFMYFHRSAIFLEYIEQNDLLKFPQITKPHNLIGYPSAPIVDFRRNLAYASDTGLHVVKADPNQHHDVRNRIEDFSAWNVGIGIGLEYVSQYTLSRPRLYADVDDLRNEWRPGIDFGNNVTLDIVIDHPHVEGFGPAISDIPVFDGSPDLTRISLIEADFVANLPDGSYGTGPISNGIRYFDAGLHRFLSDAQVGNAPVTFVPAPAQNYVLPFPLAWNAGFVLTGEKTDRLGVRNVSSEWDGEDLRFQMLPRGFYTRGDGARILRMRENFADRLDGSQILHAYDVVIPAGYPYPLGPNLGAPPSELNTPPTAGDDVRVLLRRDRGGFEAIVADAASVLANDTDAQLDPLRVDATVTGMPAHGTVSLLPNGNFVYFPQADFVGIDQFSYRSDDGRADSTPAIVTLDVRDGSDAIFANGFQ